MGRYTKATISSSSSNNNSRPTRFGVTVNYQSAMTYRITAYEIVDRFRIVFCLGKSYIKV